MRAPSFTATAIIVLTLGITANTTIFTLVDELLLNPFPYRDPQRLVMIWEANPARGGIAAQRTPAAWNNLKAWRTENHVFDGMEAYEIFLGYNLTGRQTPEHLSAARATPGFFNMLGVNAAQGRTFLWQDDTPNAAAIVLLTEKFATRHFPAQNPIGQRLLLDGQPYIVIGVLPKSFHLPAFFEGLSEYKPDIWLPLPKVAANDPPQLARRTRLIVWGRLKPNVSLAQAREDMKNVAA
ncbi:MAG TPA: ABC transporter permease, partial [Candidatus Angelobacter sp.]